MHITTQLTKEPIDGGALEAALNAGGAGAVVSFRGVMRPETKSGEPLDRMVLDWHPRMTARSLVDIARDGAARFDVTAVHIIHRCGVITPGELIVFVGVASHHRREAFQAADYLMDRLKTDAVFWKREEGAFGRQWIEPTARDHTDRQRWSKT